VSAKVLFDGVEGQLFTKGFIARGGQIIDATLVPASKQQVSREERDLIKQGAMPADWKPAKAVCKQQSAVGRETLMPSNRHHLDKKAWQELLWL